MKNSTHPKSFFLTSNPFLVKKTLQSLYISTKLPLEETSLSITPCLDNLFPSSGLLLRSNGLPKLLISLLGKLIILFLHLLSYSNSVNVFFLPNCHIFIYNVVTSKVYCLRYSSSTSSLRSQSFMILIL